MAILNRISIRSQLRLLAVCVALPGFLVWTWDFAKLTEASLELAEAQTQLLARQVAGDMAGTLRDREVALAHLVDRPMIRALDPARCDPIIRQYSSLNPFIASVTVRDRDGRLMCSSSSDVHPILTGELLEAFRRVVAADRFVVTDLLRSDLAVEYFVALTYPIRDGGVPVGIALSPLDLKTWNAALLQTPQSRTRLEVTDGQGQIILSSESPARIGRVFDGIEHPTAAPGARGSERAGRIWASASVPRTNWVVWAGMPRAEALAPFAFRQQLSFVLGAAMLGSTFLLAWLIGRGILGPVARLSARSAEIAEGDLKGRFTPTGTRELVKVAQSFNGVLDAFDAQRRELESFLANLPGVAYRIRWDDDGSRRFEFVSDGILPLLGYRPDELVGIDGLPDALVHPDDRQGILRSRSDLISTGKAERNLRLVAKDGTALWIATRQRVTARDDTSIVYDGMMLDVTELVTAQEKLRTSETNMKRILFALNMTSDGFCVVDPEGHIQYTNSACADIVGLGSQALLALSWRGLLDSGAMDEIGGNFDTPAGTQVRWRRPEDGRQVCLQIASRSLPQGGLVATISDVTDDVLARERETDERARIEHSRRLEALGQLAGGIAHDFNNLVGAMGGFAQFLHDDLPAGSPQRQFAERILDASRRAKALVNQILTFARRQDADLRPLALNDLLGDTLGLLRTMVPMTTILQADQVSRLVVLANADQIGQLLINLCLNASDALLGETGLVSLSVEQAHLTDMPKDLVDRADDPGAFLIRESPDGWLDGAIGSLASDGSYALVRIADNGTGMPRQVLNRLFEPFFTTKRRGAGTGLGMPMVHGIVLGHDGALTVRTKPGSGTVFALFLPLLRDESPVAAQIASAHPAPAGRALSGAMILLVDDERDFADMLAVFLERQGAEVAVCDHPHEALEAIRDNPDHFDLLISDQSMPEMKGSELIRLVRDLAPALPCIICTGDAGSLTPELAFTAGAVDLLKKPLDFDNALRSVHAALQAKASAFSGPGA